MCRGKSTQQVHNVRAMQQYVQDDLIAVSLLHGELLADIGFDVETMLTQYTAEHLNDTAVTLVNGAAEFDDTNAKFLLLDNLRTSAVMCFGNGQHPHMRKLIERIVDWLRQMHFINPLTT